MNTAKSFPYYSAEWLRNISVIAVPTPAPTPAYPEPQRDAVAIAQNSFSRQ